MRSLEWYMRLALSQARIAYVAGETPVGAVVAKDGAIISAAYNLREGGNDPCAHAEIIALRRAAKRLGGWRLDGCELFVTLEPCPMCAGAIAAARLKALYFGAFDKNMGCAGSVYDICADRHFGAGVPALGGVLEAPCQRLLKDFFMEKRRK